MQEVCAHALQQPEELAPLNVVITVFVSRLVRAHYSRFMVKVWAVHGFVDLTADDSLVNLGEREPTVAVDIDLMKERGAGWLETTKAMAQLGYGLPGALG